MRRRLEGEGRGKGRTRVHERDSCKTLWCVGGQRTKWSCTMQGRRRREISSSRSDKTIVVESIIFFSIDRISQGNRVAEKEGSRKGRLEAKRGIGVGQARKKRGRVGDKSWSGEGTRAERRNSRTTKCNYRHLSAGYHDPSRLYLASRVGGEASVPGV